jgi:hypothetical protein
MLSLLRVNVFGLKMKKLVQPYITAEISGIPADA